MTQKQYEYTINEMLDALYAIILPLQDSYSNSRDWAVGRGACLHLPEGTKANVFMPKIRRVLKRYEHILEMPLCKWNRRTHTIDLTIKNRKEIKQWQNN